MIFNILESFFYPFFAIVKAFGEALISMFPVINHLNDIAGAFSWTSIIAGFLGVSASVFLFFKFIIKRSLNHK